MEEQIIPIKAGTSNAYLVLRDDNAILVDTGSSSEGGKVIDAVHRTGLPPDKIRLIILTHAHYDHCKGLKNLKKITNAGVLAHVDEKQCLENGFCEIPKGTNPGTKLLSFLGRNFGRNMASYDPVSPDITINEKYELREYGINGFILPTPGHTSGSLCSIIGDNHLIAGDTLFHISPKNVFPPFANDVNILLKSWKKLIDLNCDHFYPGHGKPFGRDLFLKTYEKQLRKIGEDKQN